jgi:hypothetical protein
VCQPPAPRAEPELLQPIDGIGGDHCGDRAAGLGVGQVVVTVEIVAAQGKKELAGCAASAVGRQAAELDILAKQLAVGCARNGQEIHHHGHSAIS